MSSSNPSVFFFFLVLQSLSGSLQRIWKETFSSTSNECFSPCTGLPNVSMQIELILMRHGLLYSMATFMGWVPSFWVGRKWVLRISAMLLPLVCWRANSIVFCVGGLHWDEEKNVGTRIGLTSFPEGVETRDRCSCTLLFSLFTPRPNYVRICYIVSCHFLSTFHALSVWMSF